MRTQTPRKKGSCVKSHRDTHGKEGHEKTEAESRVTLHKTRNARSHQNLEAATAESVLEISERILPLVLYS